MNTKDKSMTKTLLTTCGLLLGTFSPAAAAAEFNNTAAVDGGAVTLKPGPNVEGVVFLHGAEWTDEVIEAFHSVPWIDAASIRLPWDKIEPEDQKFDWTEFDKVVEEVRKYNARYNAHCKVHVRPMSGRFCPKWFESKGVKFYETTSGEVKGTLRCPLPYDNPEFIKQLREIMRAMIEHYKDEPLVGVYHGTWSAGPWDEIFLPHGDAPMPPGYTPEKFINGMLEQLDAIIDETAAKGIVSELAFSGLYPSKRELDLTGALTRRIVERLGKRNPFLIIQSNGWGCPPERGPVVSVGHQLDVDGAYGNVNLSFQAWGVNNGNWNRPQGDWVPLVNLAKRYEASYLEVYLPDFKPLDTKNHIVQAFTQTMEQSQSGADDAVPNFIGWRPYLQQRKRTLYVREGSYRRMFDCGDTPLKIDYLMLAQSEPSGTSIKYRARTRLKDGQWSEWKEAASVQELPAGNQAQLEALLHTDDGIVTPRVVNMQPVTGTAWGKSKWTDIATSSTSATQSATQESMK